MRTTFNAGRTRPLEYRVKQLQNVNRLIEENYDSILDALFKDMKKTRHEGNKKTQNNFS